MPDDGSRVADHGSRFTGHAFEHFPVSFLINIVMLSYEKFQG